MIHSIITKKSRVLFLLLSISILTNAQISVNTTGSTANTSAMLDVSSTDKGMLIPRMTSAQRAAISTPADGLLVFDTTTDSFWYYNGTAVEWQKVGNVVAGASELNELSDTKYDGESLFIGSGTGQFDNGSNYNVGVGREALRSNISGYSNTSVGYYSMNNNETGNNNTSMGSTSMYSNTNGYNNVAFGRSTMYSNTSGFLNTAVGSTASESNTSGIKNTSIGSSSLYENTVGSYNTGIGNNANYYNQTGSSNTIIGYDAGKGTALHNKSGNIFLGYQSGFNETGSNKLYIENSNSTTPLIGGDFTNDSIFFNGVVRITGGNPGTNKLLTSDANGNATWETNTAATEINELSDAIYDGVSLFLGENAGSNDDGGNSNNAIGSFAFASNTTGHGNSVFGRMALYSNIDGNRNIAIGSSALLDNTSGNDNIAMGYYCLSNNIIGINNTVIGNKAGYNTTGSGNILIGHYAGYNETGSNKLYIENSNSATPLIGGDFASDYVDINGDFNLSGSIKIEGGTPGVNKILTSDADGNATWETNTGATEINELSDGINDGVSLFLGGSAGSNDDGANYNVGVGISSLQANTSGGYNTANGYYSLRFNTTGNYNIAYGYYTLVNNLSGTSNIAIGSNSLGYNLSGNSNIAVGSLAANQNTTGDYNVALGTRTNFYNQAGTSNTIIGYEAGKGNSNHSKSGNIFFGYQAGYNETGSNKLYIENSNSATPLIGGDFTSNYVDINGDLNLSGSIKIEGGVPGVNKILTSDADGNATWETSSSVTELNDLSDAIYDGGNLYLGTNAGINSNANLLNVGVGKFALEDNIGGFMNTSTGNSSQQKNTNGHNNTSYGYYALKSNLTANYNTAIGSTALQNNTATENTALGYASLTANTSGTNNVSVGGNALKANINGHYNTAVGFDALQANQSALYNTALGAKSLYNTTGERNSASGFYSLYSNTTGAYNTAFGYRSGYDNTTGTYNTFLGYNARANNTTAKTNSTAVGNDAVITASNQVRIGNASVTSIGGYADWTNISDKRFKSNIKENVLGLDFILKLRPVTYNLDIDLINEFLGVENSSNSSAKTHKLQTGFIAQEVEIAAHELGYSFSGVDTPENEKDHYGLRYSEFVVPLVKAVQEQQEMIEQLQLENNELKKIQLEVEELKKSIKMLHK
ncbi:MAG: tail fiber domain-containing protein [Bacteroidota bacterium]